MNNKKILFFGIAFVVILTCLISIFSIISNKKSDGFDKVSIYYYDKTNNKISPEKIKLKLSKNDFVNTIFTEMKSQPKSSNLKSTVPQNLSILNYNLNDNLLTVNFSKDYNKMTEIDKLIFKASFVWSLTDTDFVKNIKFLVDGKSIAYNKQSEILNRNNIVLNPSISPDKIQQETVVLYFANKENKLVAEDRNIEFKQNKSMELHIVEELIAGPEQSDTLKTIPLETKIRNIKTEDSICYVDLSSDFINKMPPGQQQQSLAIYSIVNSLTNLDTVNKVQFLIDGEKTTLLNQPIDISQPIGRYEDIIEQTTNS